MYVRQARVDDIFKHHQHTKRPSALMDQKNMKIRKKANEDLQGIFILALQKKEIYN